MQLNSLAFLLGVILLHQHDSLPNPLWSLLLIPLVFAFKFGLIRPIVVFSLGYLWALLIASHNLSVVLPSELEKKDLEVVGVVDSIPVKESRRIQFTLKVESMRHHQNTVEFPAKIKLSWYEDYQDVKLGQKWMFTVRLKKPRGFRNPGGFDYERWLFTQNIRAQGYVRSKSKFHLLEDNTNSLRQKISDEIDLRKSEMSHDAFIAALSIGDRQAMTDEQWQVLLKTGTNHLMAISGLHIGLVAGLCFFLGRWCWSRSVRLIHWWPAPKAAAIAAIMGATYYSFLAGFSIPTQRALIMVVVVMIAYIQLKQRSPSSILSIALLLVILWDPMSVLSASFWLSFAAVAILIYGLSGRIGASGLWWKWGRAQWLLFVGLLPLLLFSFQKASIIAPIANIIAVPWVSLIVVPLSLLSSTFSLIHSGIADFLFQLTDTAFELIWLVLLFFSNLSWSQWYQAEQPLWMSLGACVGVVLLLAPRGLPIRLFGIVWMLPLLFFSPERPKEGELWITLLDVGQGLSVVVQTSNHSLVYDTGPKFSKSFDTGKAVVVPYLTQQLGVDQLDVLLIGHGDNDHIGGAQSVISAMDVLKIVSSETELLSYSNARECKSGDSWSWDGVSFEILHPTPGFQGKENDRSCVLLVTTDNESVLMTGDIEKRAERQLLKQNRGKLDADILVVPHHGSNTSSSEAFIDAVSPKIALFAVGYKNQFGFPKQDVLDRYKKRGITIYDTVSSGAIRFRLNGDNQQFRAKTFLDDDRYYWHSN